MNKRAHIIVSGIVQGVFFRYSTQKKAHQLGVTGWVRNLHGGGVEIVCEGKEEDIDELVRWSRKGPPGAFVEHAEVSWEQYAGEFATFEIRY